MTQNIFNNTTKLYFDQNGNLVQYAPADFFLGETISAESFNSAIDPAIISDDASYDPTRYDSMFEQVLVREPDATMQYANERRRRSTLVEKFVFAENYDSDAVAASSSMAQSAAAIAELKKRRRAQRIDEEGEEEALAEEEEEEEEEHEEV